MDISKIRKTDTTEPPLCTRCIYLLFHLNGIKWVFVSLFTLTRTYSIWYSLSVQKFDTIFQAFYYITTIQFQVYWPISCKCNTSKSSWMYIIIWSKIGFSCEIHVSMSKEAQHYTFFFVDVKNCYFYNKTVCLCYKVNLSNTRNAEYIYIGILHNQNIEPDPWLIICLGVMYS